MAETIFWIIIAFVFLDFFFSTGLGWLNQKQWRNKLPGFLSEFYDQQEYLKAKNYHQNHFNTSLISGSISVVILLAVLFTGAFGWLDEYLRQFIENPVFLALAYFGVLFIASDILGLPFSLYSVFVIEEKFGFNKTDLKTFFTDKLKGYLLTIIIGGLLGGLLIWLIIEIGPSFWIYGWIIFTAFAIFMNYFHTTLIVPLFNKLTPLEDGELRNEIDKLAQNAGFPVSNIYVLDGSKRSSKANAFFTGFGSNKKIVLYDTLLENHTNDEILNILAHEIGHYKKKHIVVNMTLSVLQTGIMLFILSRFIYSENLALAMGASEQSIHVNLIAFGILFGPISMILGLIFNVISRKHEFEADAFAANTTGNAEAMKEALKKLSVKHLANLHPHPFYVFLNYSHPPVLDRLRALDKYNEKQVSYE